MKAQPARAAGQARGRAVGGWPAAARRVDMELVISYVLIGGVAASLALLLAGMGMYAARYGRLELDWTLPGENLFSFVRVTARHLASGAVRPEDVVDLGIAVLMLTPFARVAFSVGLFAFSQRNVKYTLITLFVLGVLTYSLFLR